MPPVFDDPVAEPRCAAGSRSSNISISVRPERPSSSVRPQPKFHEKEFPDFHEKEFRDLDSATAASRRRQRVGRIAGRSADRRLWVGATLARARI